jgi:hypothetical protein
VDALIVKASKAGEREGRRPAVTDVLRVWAQSLNHDFSF